MSRWERDVLGRVSAVFHDAEGTVDRFFFDTAVSPSGRPLLGLLGSMESGDGVIDTFEYDDLARPRAQTRLVDGRFLRMEDTLDEYGRVRSTQLPDVLGFGAVTVSNEYDPASGEPTEVRLNGARVWHLDAQDARGAPTEETLGSGALGVISRTSGYTEGGQLATLRSSSGLAELQDLHYLYESGRLWSRDDLLAPRTEVFAYDQLSRLTDVFEGAVAREHYVSDEVGNLLSTHDGTLVYGDPTRPYAATEVSGVDGATLEYDAVGNAERAGDLRITYTQRNLPRTVDSSKSGLVRYAYDAEGGRATKRGRDVDVTYFGLYELERRGMVLYERISIPTPVGVVAQLERVAPGGPNNPERLRWLLTDRQGSVETTWLPGEDPEHHRYDAYGGVLSDSGGVSGERPSESVSSGYTGHEHEDEVGLINMGGRVYMPRLRRFLTADPVVTEPVGQGLNAYSYVQGDPINWADPSGWNREGPGYQLPEDVRDPRGLSRGPYGADCDEGGLCVYDPDYVHGERGGAGAAGQATATARDESPLDMDMVRLAAGAARHASFEGVRSFVRESQRPWVYSMKSGPLERALLERFFEDTGEPLELTRDQVGNASDGVLDPFGPPRGASGSGFAAAIDELASAGGGAVPEFRASSGANLRALGQAGVLWEGRLEVASDGSWTFDGFASVSDQYDFDPRELGTPYSRELVPEAATRVGAGLAGTGFSVASVRIPAHLSSSSPQLQVPFTPLPIPSRPTRTDLIRGAPGTALGMVFVVPHFYPYVGHEVPHPMSRLSR